LYQDYLIAKPELGQCRSVQAACGIIVVGPSQKEVAVADVFISYSQRMPASARSLAEGLKAKGYDVWWDTRLVGGDKFDDVIRDQLDGVEAVIVVWTTESVRSKYVRMEAGIALGWGKRLVPVREADLPRSAIPAPFGDYQTLSTADLEGICLALDDAGIRPQRAGRRKNFTPEEFMSELQRVDASLPGSVSAWLQKCSQEGFRTDLRRYLMIKAAIPKFGEINLGSLLPSGAVQTNYIAHSSEEVGDPTIARDYHDGIARLIEGAVVNREGTSWNWRVEVFRQLPRIPVLLAKSDEWLTLMKATRERFIKAAAVSAVY
jgi:hypothetical protein